MGVDQFLLTWNNHQSNFPEVFSQLRFQDQLVDVTLLCDGGSYPAHRLVLAACSPYFHNLFTHLPTQHPLVYLKDVRQAELEALLEFIYRGEVSVANSELSGLIKIAESLRIKGLGDVSQRDASSSHVSHKRPSSPPGKATKVPRYHPTDVKPEMDLTSLLSAAQSYQNLDIPPFGKLEPLHPEVPDHADILRESKLRSCLEGQDLQPGPSYPPLLTGPPKIFSDLLKKEEPKSTICKKLRKDRNPMETAQEVDTPEILPACSDAKNDSLVFNADDNSNQTASNEDNLLLPNLRKLYESSDLGGTNFFTKYTQLLSSLQQQAQPVEEDSNMGYSSLMPTSMIDPQVSPPPKDPKSLTCNLCGATIKHIANFRRHMKQHLNPRRFPCPWCSAAFGRKDNLKTHTRKHHPAEVEAEEQTSVVGNSSNDPGGADETNPMENFNGTAKSNDSPQSSDTAKNEDETAVDDGLVIAEEDEPDEDDIEEIDSH